MTLREPSIGTELSKGSTLTDKLSKALLDVINAGEFRPGEKLPTGQELARRFGVSLTVVRESISTLKADGIIETRQGAGAFVSKSAHLRPFRITPAGASEDQPAIGPEQIFELRTGVEMQAAALAAERASDEQLAAIRDAYTAMLADIQAGGDGVTADIQFHRAIAEAAGNALFGSFLDFLGGYIRESIKGSREDQAWTEHQDAVMQEHHAIMQAICDRDVQAAREAAHAHMANCLQRCLP